MSDQPRHVVRRDGIRRKIEKRLLGLEVSKLQHKNDLGGMASALSGRRPFRLGESEIFRALEIIEIWQGVESMPLLGRQHREPPGASRSGGRIGARTGPRRRCSNIPEIVHFRVCMPARMTVPWGWRPRRSDHANDRFRESQSMAPPIKPTNTSRRAREHLAPAEIDQLISAARRLGRHGRRDAAMILLAYRHGLRVSELVSLRREQLDLRQGLLHVRRRKNGLPSTHPLRGPELRALREVLREYPDSAYVFVSERGAPMTDSTFRKLLTRAGTEAGLGLPVHPHMLRHSTGFKLANDGQDTRAIQHYLGHRNIQHTVVYTNLASNRFNDFWKD